jgi:hypothetical protein
MCTPHFSYILDNGEFTLCGFDGEDVDVLKLDAMCQVDGVPHNG